MAADLQKQFRTFRTLPQLPSRSNTPHAKTPRLLGVKESKSKSRSSLIEHPHSPRPLSPNIIPNIDDSEHSRSSKFSGDEIFSRNKPQNDIENSNNINNDDDKNDSVDSSSSKFKRLRSKQRRHSLHSVHGSKEKSISIKSVPNNMHLIPKTPILGLSAKSSSYIGYSQIGDNDDLEEEEEEEEEAIIIEETRDVATNMNDTTTDASKKLITFRRKRGVPQFDTEDIDNKHDGTTELSNGNLTEFSQSTAISRSKSSKTQRTSLRTPRSKCSMKDELKLLNLQKIIIKTTVETESDEFDDNMDDNDDNDDDMIDSQKAALPKHCIKPKTMERNISIRGVQFYINIRNILSLLSLIAIGTSQFVYYRYYYLCGVLTVITCLFYIILLIPSLYHNYTLYKSYWYSFGLVVIRLFHIMSILSIFAGVETCFFHYQRSVEFIESVHNDHSLNILTGLLYGFISTSMIICYFQNVYVIKYDQNMVFKWKLFYCCKGKYFVNEDGSWTNDQHPISGCNGLFTFVLFITTFGALLVSVICINKMEFIIKEQEGIR